MKQVLVSWVHDDAPVLFVLVLPGASCPGGSCTVNESRKEAADREARYQTDYG